MHARALGAASITVFVALIALVLALPSLQQMALRSPQIAAIVTAVLVNITNTDRAKESLSPLTVNPQLVAIAQMKANDMAEKGYFAHTSPEGVEPWHWFREGEYAYQYAGENLAVNFADSEEVSAAWMASPTHRENILDGRFTEIGIATAQGNYQGRTTTFVVQMFGTPRVARSQSGTLEASVIPNDPELIAFAADPAAPQEVLSERSVGKDDAASPQSFAVATTEPAVAAALAESAADDSASPAAYLFGYPKTAVRIAFNLLGVLLAVLLAIETGLEIKRRHRSHMLIAGGMLILIVIAFVVADQLLFALPLIR